MAHAETPAPWFISSFSFGKPISLALAPVAMMSARAWCTWPLSDVTAKGRLVKSTRSTFSAWTMDPKRSACFLKRSIISGPLMPSGNPG